MARYRFGEFGEIVEEKLGGRAPIPKALRKDLIVRCGGRCELCFGDFDDTFLQIDHRIPYGVAGEIPVTERNSDSLLVLCRSCRIKKSWACENCENWQGEKERCHSCFWAYPDEYEHIAMEKIRRLELIWSGDEVRAFEELEKRAAEMSMRPVEYAKAALLRRMSDLENER